MEEKIKRLEQAIELFNNHKEIIFINGFLIFNYYNGSHNRELCYTAKNGIIDCWVNGALVFSTKIELVRTIETKHEILYREDETLLW